MWRGAREEKDTNKCCQWRSTGRYKAEYCEADLKEWTAEDWHVSFCRVRTGLWTAKSTTGCLEMFLLLAALQPSHLWWGMCCKPWQLWSEPQTRGILGLNDESYFCVCVSSASVETTSVIIKQFIRSRKGMNDRPVLYTIFIFII